MNGYTGKEDVIDFEWETEKLIQQKEETMRDISKFSQQLAELKRSVDDSDIHTQQSQLNDQASTLDETIKEIEAEALKITKEHEIMMRVSSRKFREIERTYESVEDKCKTARVSLDKELSKPEIASLREELKQAESRK